MDAYSLIRLITVNSANGLVYWTFGCTVVPGAPVASGWEEPLDSNRWHDDAG